MVPLIGLAPLEPVFPLFTCGTRMMRVESTDPGYSRMAAVVQPVFPTQLEDFAEMNRVYCHDGKCEDPHEVDTVFRNMFDSKNIVDEIQRDLWRYSAR